MSMTTFDDLAHRHQTLLDKLDETKNFISLSDEIFEFLDDIEKGSSEIPSLMGREQLQAFMRFWGATIYDNTGTYPNTKLRPSLNLKAEDNLADNHSDMVKSTQRRTLDQIEHEVTSLIKQDKPSFERIRELLTEITEQINNSEEWDKLDYDNKNLANELQAELKELLKNADSAKKDAVANIREPRAEELMEQAERVFYSGRYQDAMRYYDQVLHLEPEWERAKEHRTQADDYMTRGHIPETMLPAEAASLFGKAQSAARVMRLKDAMDMLESAREILLQNGVTRWNEGAQFERQLQSAIDAQEVAKEAENLFTQGRINDAIEKVELASGLTGYPKYKATAEMYREFNLEVKSLYEILSAGTLALHPLLEASKRLTVLSSLYSENQVLNGLQARFNNLKPILVEKMKQEVREVRSKVERYESLDIIYLETEKTKALLEEALNSEIASDPVFLALYRDIIRIKSDIEDYKTDISKANDEYRKHRSWPAKAWKISKDVRKYYPNDPDVIRLKKDLQEYKLRIGVVQTICLIIVLGLIVILIKNIL